MFDRRRYFGCFSLIVIEYGGSCKLNLLCVSRLDNIFRVRAIKLKLTIRSCVGAIARMTVVLVMLNCFATIVVSE